MLELILPPGVVSRECFGEPSDAVLLPEEEQFIAYAVPSRRGEFAVVRHLARACLARLGYAPVPILPGAGGAPVWPVGVRGSMTHCAGYAAAALGCSTAIAGIGIDAEPDAPLPDGVLELVATPAEQDRLTPTRGESDGLHWDRLLFSAKEAIYKTWFPLVGDWLDHQDADITFHPNDQTFTAQLSRDGLIINGHHIHQLHGRWTRNHTILATAVVLSASRKPGTSQRVPGLVRAWAANGNCC
jgi:4'-phosphopantetheinyl transferase EntD